MACFLRAQYGGGAYLNTSLLVVVFTRDASVLQPDPTLAEFYKIGPFLTISILAFQWPSLLNQIIYWVKLSLKLLVSPTMPRAIGGHGVVFRCTASMLALSSTRVNESPVTPIMPTFSCIILTCNISLIYSKTKGWNVVRTIVHFYVFTYPGIQHTVSSEFKICFQKNPFSALPFQLRQANTSTRETHSRKYLQKIKTIILVSLSYF